MLYPILFLASLLYLWEPARNQKGQQVFPAIEMICHHQPSQNHQADGFQSDDERICNYNFKETCIVNHCAKLISGIYWYQIGEVVEKWM